MTTKFDKFYECIIEQSITRTNDSEIKFYIDDIFGNFASDIISRKSEMSNNHPKFSHSIVQFIYKGQQKVVVFSGPGEKSSLSDNGSLSVSVFIYPNKDSKSYINKETNAFYNESTKTIDYDPVLRNGRDVVFYVKSVLEEDDRDKDFNLPTMPTNPKQSPKPVMV